MMIINDVNKTRIAPPNLKRAGKRTQKILLFLRVVPAGTLNTFIQSSLS